MIGSLCGFASMIGNAAGPIFAVYLLAVNLDKKHYLGTTAWFFLIINLIKLPLQIFSWHNITLQTTIAALLVLPAIFLGTRLGIWVAKLLPEKTFRKIIIIMTGIGGVSMFFQ